MWQAIGWLYPALFERSELRKERMNDSIDLNAFQLNAHAQGLNPCAGDPIESFDLKNPAQQLGVLGRDSELCACPAARWLILP
jgi:hypothetical protein